MIRNALISVVLLGLACSAQQEGGGSAAPAEDASADINLSPNNSAGAPNVPEAADSGVPEGGPASHLDASARHSSDASSLSGLRTEAVDLEWRDPSGLSVPARVYAPELGSPGSPYAGVIISHGLGESRSSYDYLGKALAANGFIAVFITHPDSDNKSIEGVDWRNPADFGGPESVLRRMQAMRFAVDQLLAVDAGSAILSGRVDPQRIAVAGQCAGSSTAAAVAGLDVGTLETDFRDDRVRALVMLGPQPPAPPLDKYVPEPAWNGVELPSLSVVGSRDFGWIREVRRDPTLIERPHALIPALPKPLLVLDEGFHHAFTDSEPYYPAPPRNPQHHECLTRTTIAFLRAVLDGDAAAVAWIASGELTTSTGGNCTLTAGGGW